MATRDPRWLILLVLLFLVVAVGTVLAQVPALGADALGTQADPARKNMWLVGIVAVFVGIYWVDRFNVPEAKKTETSEEQEKHEEIRLPATNRSSTTASRHYSAAAMYSGVGVAAYLILVLWPEDWNHLAEVQAASGAEALPAWLHETSSLFVVALGLTVLIPKIPGFRHPEAWLATTK